MRYSFCCSTAKLPVKIFQHHVGKHFDICKTEPFQSMLCIWIALIWAKTCFYESAADAEIRYPCLQTATGLAWRKTAHKGHWPGCKQVEDDWAVGSNGPGVTIDKVDLRYCSDLTPHSHAISWQWEVDIITVASHKRVWNLQQSGRSFLHGFFPYVEMTLCSKHCNTELWANLKMLSWSGPIFAAIECLVYKELALEMIYRHIGIFCNEKAIRTSYTHLEDDNF